MGYDGNEWIRCNAAVQNEVIDELRDKGIDFVDIHSWISLFKSSI
jgi:predicted PP-loop superfamily ATPase